MNRKSLKQVVVVLTVVSFFMMTSVSAFAQSANRSNNFNTLGNIPEQEAIQLSDGEMAKVKGEVFLLGLLVTVFGAVIGSLSLWNSTSKNGWDYDRWNIKNATGVDIGPYPGLWRAVNTCVIIKTATGAISECTH